MSIAKWEIVGAVFVCVVGVFSHFLFQWTNEWLPIAWFVPVNESVWEHLKLCVWPYSLFAVMEYPFVRVRAANFISAKAAGILIMPTFVTTCFYGYTTVAGSNYLALDIGLFLATVSLGFATSYRLFLFKPLPQWVHQVAAAMWLVTLLGFIVFTFSPPKIVLFEDPVHGHYGVVTVPDPVGSG
jgi:hypothetical protein